MKKFISFKKLFKAGFLTFFSPVLVLGFSLKASTFSITIDYIRETIDLLIPILSALAFLAFFWGLSKFILNSAKPEEIKNGQTYMMWGVLALFILLSFKTLIGLVSNELEIGDKNPDRNSILLPIEGSNASVTTDEDFRLKDGTQLRD